MSVPRTCVFVFGHFERLVIFDDELPAVSALSRSNLKMAERPQAKPRCKVGVDWLKPKIAVIHTHLDLSFD